MKSYLTGKHLSGHVKTSPEILRDSRTAREDKLSTSDTNLRWPKKKKKRKKGVREKRQDELRGNNIVLNKETGASKMQSAFQEQTDEAKLAGLWRPDNVITSSLSNE
jgi:hypothetical protein